MLDIFYVTSADGRVRSFPIRNSSSGYAVESIKGLDPTKASLVSSSFALLPGAKFQSTKREVRNIVITIKFMVDHATQSVESLRNMLYQYFMPESQISLRFENTAGLSVRISGVVESFEAPLFEKEPAADISIICHDPDFVETDEIQISGNTTSTTTEMMFDYDGTIPTGFRFVLNVNRSITTFTIYHRTPDNLINMLNVNKSLVAGNVVTINTVLGDKYARLVSGGIQSSIVGNVSPQSAWSQFKFGENGFRVTVAGAAIPYDIFYMNKYGGL